MEKIVQIRDLPVNRLSVLRIPAQKVQMLTAEMPAPPGGKRHGQQSLTAQLCP